MIRNLKVLGLALVALLAMSAMVASAASAHPVFTAPEGSSIKAEDTGKIKFTVTGQEVFCEKAVFTGSAGAAPINSITVNATYEACKSGLGTTATVTGFGQHGESGKCNFVLYSTGTADLVCPSGQDVTVDVGPCVVHIPAQTGLSKVTYTNDEKAGDINIDLNVTEITANHTDGFLCPFGSSGHVKGAVLETPEKEPLTAVGTPGPIKWDP